jgi:hypothetical protein
MIFFVQVSSLINRLILDFHCCVFSFLFVIHFVSSLFPGMSFVFECYYPLGDNVVASRPRSLRSVLISLLSRMLNWPWVWLKLPMAMNCLGLPGVEISVLWGSALLMSRKSFRDLSVMARLKSCRIWHLIWMVLRVCPGVNRTLWRWLTLCWRPLWSWKGFWRGCKSM